MICFCFCFFFVKNVIIIWLRLMEEDFEIMPNLLDRRRLKDRIIENISKAVKNVRLRLTFQELED